MGPVSLCKFSQIVLTVTITFMVCRGDDQPGDPQKNVTELVNSLDQGNLQEAFRLLQSEYIKKEAIDPLNVNRAAIQGLLERLDFGAMLLTEESLSDRNAPYSYYSSKVDEKIGYIRFGQFTRQELEQLDQTLTAYTEEEKPPSTIILDLRSPQVQADFTIASQILSRFRPPNELLFKIRRPSEERPVLYLSKANPASWVKETVILVDRETGNLGEIIARVLQEKNRCLVVGEQTRGLTVEYRDVKIGDDRILRYAIAEVTLEDESSIFQIGIKPDLPTEKPSLAAKHEFFKQTNDGQAIKPYVFAVERPRFNERSLVEGTNPELEVELAKKNNLKTAWNVTLPQDRVLQKAVDILRTQHFLDSGKRRRKLR